MLKTLKETTVIRDPIHEYIEIKHQVVLDCIDTKEFQRLRRIHQLGGTAQAFPTGEHSRFSHALGVYHLVTRLLNNVSKLKDSLTEFEQISLQLAGLLHDVGHGPFSHTFEHITQVSHELRTNQIILEKSEIHEVLKKAHPDLPETIVAILNQNHQNSLLNQIIVGQLDVDRMDYLLRDAYFTGVEYGVFDLGKIIHSIDVFNNQIVIKESAIHAVEDYIMARYHMYWQVYFHRVSRSFEIILNKLFQRIKDVYKSNPEYLKDLEMFLVLLNNSNLSNDEFYLLDESSWNYGFQKLKLSPDKVLADLSRRLLERKLFTNINYIDEKQEANLALLLQEKGYHPKYYLAKDVAIARPYYPYLKNENVIWVLGKDNQIKELSEVSEIVLAITKGEDKQDRKLFFPKIQEDQL